MVAIKTLDGRRSPNSSKPGGSTGPRGGTGKRNSPSNILLKLMEKHPRILKLISSIKKKKPKTMKAAKGGMTKKQFDGMSTAQMDKLSNAEIMELLIKFYPDIGKSTDQEYFKMGEGGYRKKGGVIKPIKAATGGKMGIKDPLLNLSKDQWLKISPSQLNKIPDWKIQEYLDKYEGIGSQSKKSKPKKPKSKLTANRGGMMDMRKAGMFYGGGMARKK